ncbi:secreted RxLR effector protein 161-like [Diospyros lotus]|uniref:secreted RxLR effector protein 161-like n=1 Tax=Diospyros lotus TaxID=55363 RepID=UPI0022577E8A|nr:secreted RxLR effector protein 161-like [Diospyros lotus]
MTRPDIVYGVSLLSRYMETPRESHWQVAKRILRYIKGTLSFGLQYAYGEKLELIGYSDSDWARDPEEHKSTTRYVFFYSTIAFSWSSKKQSVIALSTCEAEYVAVAFTVCEAIWLKNLVSTLGCLNQEPVIIYVDNKSAIKLTKNPIQHGRSKHIDTRFHFICQHVKQGTVELEYYHTLEQVVNIFTKPLSFKSFEKLRKMLGMKELQQGSSAGKIDQPDSV